MLCVLPGREAKMETGENPVRYRHCNEVVLPIMSLGNREGRQYDDLRVRIHARSLNCPNGILAGN